MRALLVVWVWFFWCAVSLPAAAKEDLTFWPQAAPAAYSYSSLKPVAVIYFPGPNEERIASMVAELQGDFSLTVEGHRLENESELAARIETIAENPVGMVVVVAPEKLDALLKIPSLYPDINFSIVDVDKPVYLANVRTLIFDEQEGAFLIGAVAALSSPSGKIAIAGANDTPHARNFIYAFIQGAKYARGDAQVGHYFIRSKTTLDNGTDTLFLLDRELLTPTLLKRKPKRPWLITYDTALPEHGEILLTSLIRHRDLALYSVVKSYAQERWSPGSETLGVTGGYFDYALDNRNKAQLSKEIVARIEEIKDLMTQQVVRVTPATP